MWWASEGRFAPSYLLFTNLLKASEPAVGKKNQKRNGWASVPQRTSKRECGWPVWLQEPGRVCSLDPVCCRDLGTGGTWARPTSRACPAAVWLQAVQQSRRVGWSEQAAAVCGRTVFPVHIQRVLPVRTEVKRNQTKALFAQGWCFFFFFFFLRTCNHISTARITWNVQNRSLPRLLG